MQEKQSQPAIILNKYLNMDTSASTMSQGASTAGGNAQASDDSINTTSSNILDQSIQSQQPSQAVLSDADLDFLNQYLASTCYTLINVSKDYFYKELHQPNNQATLRTFATEKKVRTLVVARIEKPSAAQTNPEVQEEAKDEALQFNEEEDTEIVFTVKVQFFGQLAHSIAFVKREAHAQLDLKAIEGQGAVKPLSAQLQVLNLGYVGEDSNIFELAVNYVEHSFIPLFSTYKTTSGSSVTQDEKGKGSQIQGIENVKKDLAQLKVHLTQCLQNLEIPEIELTIDPEIIGQSEISNRNGSKLTEESFQQVAGKPEFVSRLENCVKLWLRDIARVTQMEYDIGNGTVQQEIMFHISLERSLTHIKEQIEKPEVKMTFDLLKGADKNKLILMFTHDSQLDSKLKLAQGFNRILREIPINQLLSANDLAGIDSAQIKIFESLKTFKNQDQLYPKARQLLLIDALSRDFTNQVLKVISVRPIMELDDNEFLKDLSRPISTVFETWKRESKKIDPSDQRQAQRKGIQAQLVDIERNPIFKRINQIILFRRDHSQLKSIILKTITQSQGSAVLGGGAGSRNFEEKALNDINDAYNSFLPINVLDISAQGTEIFENTKRSYDNKIDKVESQITVALKDKLASTSNANQMFKVFSFFQPLFSRPRIKMAIREYQNQILVQVAKDIQNLKEKYMSERGNEQNSMLTALRDFPAISNNITWAIQIQKRVERFQQRVKEVLGDDYDKVVGEDLDKKAQALSIKLDEYINQNYQSYQQNVTEVNTNVEKEKTVFDIVNRLNKYELVVNFNMDFFNILKEKPNLDRYGCKSSMTVDFKISDLKHLYPIVCSIQESLRTFNYTNSRVSDRFLKLIADKKNAAQRAMLEGLSIEWKSEVKVQRFLEKIEVAVKKYEEAVQDTIEKTQLIEEYLTQLTICPVQKDSMQEKLNQIQRILDDFNFNDYSNLIQWVEDLDERIRGILVKRLEEYIQIWINEFNKYSESGGKLINYKTVLEVKIQNQTIVLDPPISEARAFWYKRFHEQLENICGLQRVDAYRYEKFTKSEQLVNAKMDKTYKDLILKINQDGLNFCYSTLEKQLNAAEDYVKTWKSYQTLWDIEASYVFNLLEENIDKWHQLLNEIRQGRKTFDNSETEKSFGALTIYYGGVQAKVNNKYDQWHRDILNKFGLTIADNMRTFNQTLQKARRKLEGLSIDGSDDVAMFVTEIQEMQPNYEMWFKDLDKFKSGNKLLISQRYQFPYDWVGIEIIESEWLAFKKILETKTSVMHQQIEPLQKKIYAEETIVIQKIKEIEEQWKKEQPDQGNIVPKRALNILSIIGSRIVQTKAEWKRICKVKELIDVEIFKQKQKEDKDGGLDVDFEQASRKFGGAVATDFGDPKRLDQLEDDYLALKNLWTQLQQMWQTAVEPVFETPFSAYVFKAVNEKLELGKKSMDGFDNRSRQQPVFTEYQNLMVRYIKMNRVIGELKSEAMKQRHWKDLLQKLALKQVGFNELTVAHLVNADLLKCEKVVNDVLAQARGELILEEFLRNIKECWAKYELELIKYQTKCKLIRGWDELFQQIDEHINNLQSMKMSPYYKVFEEEILPWDDKLQKIRIIFDNWIDVQRRYVYLEGIFFGSADIKNMLPTEFSRFKSIDKEFTDLMKKVAQKPIVLEVLSIKELQKTLERFSDMLSKIQKALGEYLEKQRSNFARFYFVGDEDLLEIIGNSKEIRMVQRHFPKMFAGITQLSFENEGDHLTGMYSREGEYVNFASPTTDKVVISEDPTIYAWLTKIEQLMQMSLAHHLEQSVTQLEILDRNEQQEEFNQWIQKFAAQIVILTMQVSWSNRVEESLEKKKGLNLGLIEDSIKTTLEMLAERVLTDLKKDIRQKYEQLITDLVHQREVTRQLMNEKVTSVSEFVWLYHMRFYWRPREKDALQKLSIQMANGHFYYGFEYLGVGEKLVQTPLTDRCYLTLTQALHWRLGGSPFGPAGTGKTESVKALGSQLGRFVLVFNCDETFDGNAMGRIFVGLCQVGAWGCFDEFNRLEERMLSAVSQQILLIQVGLRELADRIELMNRNVKLNTAMGIFITMNPGYAGRSNLPDNLKQLFRQIAMVKPDKEMIARVMLYSQGFKTAEKLSGKIVSLFDLCANQLSSQSHYDFGLRALKSVLVSAGNLKRSEKAKLTEASQITVEWEQNILIKSLCDTLVPKLVAEDIPLLSSLLTGVFPGSSIIQIREEKLIEQLEKLAGKYNLVCKSGNPFIEKVLQLYQISNLHHGVMMVGPTGCGKSAAWKILLEAIEKLDGIKGESYIVDPKAIHKDDLYGRLDSTTAEWTDGVFTGILRRIIDNVRGEASRRHWIVFDGDVDPEWAENLNSVLDDNKLLTLPSGERLQIPPNVRIMFEVETLKHATLATVSRCGMVWFSEETVTINNIYNHYLSRLMQDEYDSLGEEPEGNPEEAKQGEIPQQQSAEVLHLRNIRKKCVDAIRFLFDDEESFMTKVLDYASTISHVMDFTRIRVLESTFALIRKGISNVIDYSESRSEFPLSESLIENYMKKFVIFASLWGIGGSMNLQTRTNFGNRLGDFTIVAMPNTNIAPLIDYEIRIDDQEWHLWKKKVPQIDIEPSKVVEADVVITTVDTTRHQEVLCSWISEHRPFLLCGPPGSGKTMTLMATLKNLPDFEMIFINFSSSTTPDLILKTFEHYCEIKKTPSGLILRPHNQNKWLVVFCDEINLPDTDKYGTQTVITFLRQITEQNGFWRSQDKQWVSLERIQFVGACNPPTDAGRHPLSERFLRHCPLIFVDFPGPESLKQIYGTFNRAMLKRAPALKNLADSLTDGMVEFYTKSQQHFTADMQPHYIYSPRELTRWKYAIFEALPSIDCQEDLVRLFVHEALRLFEDRLVHPHEKEWCNRTLDEVANRYFPKADIMRSLERPILFTNYLSKNYTSVKQDDLKKFIEARLVTFYEECLNIPLVVFDSVMDHILRIDRVLRQPLGHLLLVGASGVGKTTLSRFVSWMNNLSVFQIKAGRNYSVHDFDDDLRTVMRRAGCKMEKICFIFDESNVLSTAFLERMNALLASGEVPGLFDGEEYMSLINQCKEAARSEGKLTDTEEELYKTFTYNVQRNLHVVFTMNPSNPDFSNRTASSPALFNRCVIDWFGEWSSDGLLQVAKEFTKNLDILPESFSKKMEMYQKTTDEGRIVMVDPKHEALCQCIVDIHLAVKDVNTKLSKSAKRFNYITPRDFLDFIKHFVELLHEKKEELEEQQYHLNVGLNKLKETETAVLDLQKQLTVFEKDLLNKDKAANEKLKQMVQEQKEAEAKRELSIKTQKELEIKTVEIQKRQVEVNRDLSRAEPALLAAQESVSGIQKSHLDELRAFANPPNNVKLALEPVIALISDKPAKPEWKDIRQFLRQDNFISMVMNYDKDTMRPVVKKFIKTNYLDKKEEFKVEAIFKASKAAGPLAMWVQSLVEYAEIFERIQPLRNEVSELQAQYDFMKAEMTSLEELVQQLEHNIEQYKVDYSVLIGDVQTIKTDMTKVQDKVKRSKHLIQNLSAESGRWESSSQSFKEQMACLLGDVLLSAAFLTYTGFFDHFYRQFLNAEWRYFVEQIGLKNRQELSFTEFLSKPTDRLQWQVQELPNDELCIENAIILKRYNRYPLIIDPSDQALKYVMNHYQERKIQKTSFADDSFMKTLETSIRFGLPLIVQDVERIDPVLNSVLNKEVQKAGGRILIRVGDQEIDYSSSFTLFMITRNPTAVFTPDLCSRVTFVNFTVTPSSLQNQCLNIYMKNEREEVDKKRNDLLKLQGECKVKLRELEDSLLDALNKSEGNILDNNQLISTLETLKKEAAAIAKEVEKTEDTMKEIELVSNQYLPLSNMTSRIFFTLDSMSQISFLYQYSLQHFMEFIFAVLHSNETLSKLPKSNPEARLKVITSELFQYIYLKTSQGLLLEHQALFALRLTQIRLGTDYDVQFDLLLKSSLASADTGNNASDGMLVNEGVLGEGRLTKTQARKLEELSLTKAFRKLPESFGSQQADWVNFLEHPMAESCVPEIPNSEMGGKDNETVKDMKRMTILKILRPDRFISSVKTFVGKILGEQVLNIGDLDLMKIVEKESNAKSPLLLVSAPGFDASYKVDMLAKQANKKYTSVAIGSPEAFDLVDQAIKGAAKTGSWVLLKNVHLAPQWLTELEKDIYKLQLNQNFRLFLTMEINPKVPTTLLRASHVFVFEPPSGIKAALNRSYTSTIPQQRSDKVPIERARLHFLVSWFNAVVQERLRYTPIGWSKVYEFNESDQRCAIDCVDEWLDTIGKDRTNVDPNKIPWDALRTLIGQSVFGGKIDNEFDNKILQSLVNQFFRPESFNFEFDLFTVAPGSSEVVLKVPDVKTHKQFLQWIREGLPDVESPSWSGLPLNVEKLVRERQTLALVANMKVLQGTGDEMMTVGEEAKASGSGQSDKAQWLIKLQGKIEKMIKSLPLQLETLKRTSLSITNPLFRFLEREVTVASQLLDSVRSDLQLLKEMCTGERKSTNILKSLAQDLHADVIPKRWRRYNVANITVTEWIEDFNKRIDQLQKVSVSSDFGRKGGLWFGGLLFPEAFMTASRQSVAQDNKWSLEELDLQFEVDPSAEAIQNNPQGFIVDGLSIEGASYSKDDQRIKLSESLQSYLPRTNLKWINKNKKNEEDDKQEYIQIPVYLNKQRTTLLFSVKIPTFGIPAYVWYQRGVALFAWNKD